MPDERIEALLAAYVDGDVSPDESAAVERYLAANPRQRQSLAQMRSAKTWLTSLPRVAAPASLLDVIDPTLERAALFEEPAAPRSWWATPQALALAATVVLLLTLAIAVTALLPGRPGDQDQVALAPPTLPVEPATRPAPVVPLIAPEELGNDGGFTPPSVAPVPPVVPEQNVPPAQPPAVTSVGPVETLPATRPVEVPPVTVPPPAVPDGAVVVRADVRNLPAAADLIARAAAGQSLSVAGGRLASAVVLPEAFRDAAGVRPEAATVVYVVPKARMEQVGDLALRLAALAPPAVTRLAATARAVRSSEWAKAAQAEIDEIKKREVYDRTSQRIFFDDTLQIYLFRRDEPPALPQPGTPAIAAKMDLRVEVSPDGKLDLSPLGLGRVDVLGQDVKELGETIQRRLQGEYLIPLKAVDVKLADRARPPEGRTALTLEAMALDRRPLVPGDLLQVTRPDGTWRQAVVTTAAEVSFGDLGNFATRGESAASLQERVRAAQPPPTPPATEPGTLVVPSSPPPLRVVNLSARRAAGKDASAATEVPLVILLQADAAQPATEPSGAAGP